MAHQLEIGAVVACDVVDAVGELLALREQLLEIAEAAGHRLAPRIDDARVGQHQVDQSDVAEVVRHLVDEERLAGAVDAGGCQILLAERPRSPRRACSARMRRIARIARHPGRGPAGCVTICWMLGELLGTLDLRVRGEDLLEQASSPSAADRR